MAWEFESPQWYMVKNFTFQQYTGINVPTTPLYWTKYGNDNSFGAPMPMSIILDGLQEDGWQMKNVIPVHDTLIIQCEKT